MTTCDNDHEQITFEGEFRALCPLCAMRLRLTEEAEKAQQEASEAIDACEAEQSAAEHERNEVQEKLDKMEEERDALKAESDSLLGVLRDSLMSGDVQACPVLWEQALEDAKEIIHEAERRRKN